MSELWPAMLLSLQVALCATAVVALIGVPLAFLIARRPFRGRSLIEAMLTLPLVLPPTVVGYCLILAMGRRGWMGAWLDSWFDYSIMFHWHGAVLAAATVAFPLLYLPARAAFAGVDRELEDIARLHGATLLQVFWHVSLPAARRGLAAGLLLTFSRALGEFGATVMVLGDIPSRQTLPILIYTGHVSGQRGGSTTAAVWILSIISLAVILLYNRSPAGR